MSTRPKRGWSQNTQMRAMGIILLVGILFENLGKNPFSWQEPSRNVPFLCISIIAFLVSMTLPFLLRLLGIVETTRKDMPGDKELPSYLNKRGNTLRADWLGNSALMSGFCLEGIFWDMAAISRLDLFLWPGVAALGVAIVAAIVIVIRSSRVAKRQKVEQELEQWMNRWM
jgi:hypothetical protein